LANFTVEHPSSLRALFKFISRVRQTAGRWAFLPAAGRPAFVRPRVFGVSDGMPIEECSSGFCPAG
jgi:hypothetical protein